MPARAIPATMAYATPVAASIHGTAGALWDQLQRLLATNGVEIALSLGIGIVSSAVADLLLRRFADRSPLGRLAGELLAVAEGLRSGEWADWIEAILRGALAVGIGAVVLAIATWLAFQVVRALLTTALWIPVQLLLLGVLALWLAGRLDELEAAGADRAARLDAVVDVLRERRAVDDVLASTDTWTAQTLLLVEVAAAAAAEADDPEAYEHLLGSAVEELERAHRTIPDRHDAAIADELQAVIEWFDAASEGTAGTPESEHDLEAHRDRLASLRTALATELVGYETHFGRLGDRRDDDAPP